MCFERVFYNGVEELITKTCKQDYYHNDEGVWCSCSKCYCTLILEESPVKVKYTNMVLSLNIEGYLDNDDNCMGLWRDGVHIESQMTNLGRWKRWWMIS